MATKNKCTHGHKAREDCPICHPEHFKEKVSLQNPVEKGDKFWALNDTGQEKTAAVMGRCSSVARGCDLMMLKIVGVEKSYIGHLVKLLTDAKLDLQFIHDSIKEGN